MKSSEDLREGFFEKSRLPVITDQTYFCLIPTFVDYGQSVPYDGDRWECNVSIKKDYLVFLSYEDAVETADLIAQGTNNCGTAPLFNIRIERFFVGDSCLTDLPVKAWLHDSEGRLIDKTVNEHWGFFGVSERNLRFKARDIVEVLWDDQTTKLGIILDVPMSPEEAWKDAYTLHNMCINKTGEVHGLHHSHFAYEVGFRNCDIESIHPFKLMPFENATKVQRAKLELILEAYDIEKDSSRDM